MSTTSHPTPPPPFPYTHIPAWLLRKRKHPFSYILLMFNELICSSGYNFQYKIYSSLIHLSHWTSYIVLYTFCYTLILTLITFRRQRELSYCK